MTAVVASSVGGVVVLVAAVLAVVWRRCATEAATSGAGGTDESVLEQRQSNESVATVADARQVAFGRLEREELPK